MIECPMPQDVLKYKSKFIMNFSAREATCILIGAGLGLLGYFKLFESINGNLRIYLSVPLFLIPFVFGFFRPLGQPLEIILKQVVVDNFLYPPTRVYEIKHPEFEKYHEKRNFELLYELHEFEEDTKNKKRKKKNSNKKKDEIKIKKSKEFKGIR